MSHAIGRGLRKIELRVRDGNRRAMQLYLKMGFVTEGELVDDVLVDGVFENSILRGFVPRQMEDAPGC